MFESLASAGLLRVAGDSVSKRVAVLGLSVSINTVCAYSVVLGIIGARSILFPLCIERVVPVRERFCISVSTKACTKQSVSPGAQSGLFVTHGR